MYRSKRLVVLLLLLTSITLWVMPVITTLFDQDDECQICVDSAPKEDELPLHPFACHGMDICLSCAQNHKASSTRCPVCRLTPGYALIANITAGDVLRARRLFNAGVTLHPTVYRACLLDATTKNYYPIVQLLIENGVEYTLCTGEKISTALKRDGVHRAIKLMRADMNLVGHDVKNFENLLLKAAEKNNIDLAESLLLMKANPNACDPTTNQTALFKAVTSRSLAMIQLLINYKANMLTRTREGNTIMHAAAFSNSPAIITMLARMGIDINSVTDTKKRTTPLHIAAQFNKTNAIKALLENGANPCANSLGKTPLEVAIFYKQRQATAMLSQNMQKIIQSLRLTSL